MRIHPNTISRTLDGVLTALFLTALVGAILSGATLLLHYPKNAADRQDLRDLRHSQDRPAYDYKPVALPNKKTTVVRQAKF